MEHFPEEILSLKKINDLALKQPFSFFGKNVLFKCLLLQKGIFRTRDQRASRGF